MPKDAKRRERDDRSVRDVMLDAAAIHGDRALSLDPSLTTSEKHTVELLVLKGISALHDLDWPEEQIQTFLARPNVRREIDRVQQLLEDGPAILAKQTLMAKIRANTLANKALVILQKALDGGVRADGTPLPLSQQVSEMQLSAARDVLDRAGVHGNIEKQIDINLIGIRADLGTKRLESSDKEKYDIDQVMSRESVRNALEKVFDIARRYSAIQDDGLELRRLAKRRKKEKKLKKLRESE